MSRQMLARRTLAGQMRAWRLGLLAIAAMMMASPVQGAEYAIDGFVLGDSISPDNANYRTYDCRPSSEFDAAIACTRETQKSGSLGPLTISSALVRADGGPTLFAMVHAAPVKLDRSKLERELGNLGKAIGAAPTSVTWSPDYSKDLTWVIATWGEVKLDELYIYDASELNAFPRLGGLVDLFGDPGRTVDRGKPLYRMSGGAGYVYAASFDPDGKGDRHYVAVDPAGLAPLHYQSKLRGLISQDQALAADDYRLWPQVAEATRNLALATSPQVANRHLDAVFDEMQSTKLRSHVWANLPLGATERLSAGRYWRHDTYGPHTGYPAVRQGAEALIQAEPDDPYIEFAHFLLGDFTGALNASPNSPISDVLHYARGYDIVQSLTREALDVAGNRLSPDTPPDTVADLRSLLDYDPSQPDSYTVYRWLTFINKNGDLFDHKPLSAFIADFSSRAAMARDQFVAVSTASTMADDASYMIGWLELQDGNTSGAVSSFARALDIENRHTESEDWRWADYRGAVLKQLVRFVEHLPLQQQAATVEASQTLSAEHSLWYAAARAAYRNFDYGTVVDIGERAMKRMNFPTEQLPTTTDPNLIREAITRINPELVNDLNFVELPYLIEASREMGQYENELEGMSGQDPATLSAKARHIVMKYSMLVDRPYSEDEAENKGPTEHKDLRQALHMIDTTLQHTTGLQAYSRLREWLYYRRARILTIYAPDEVGKSVAEMEQEFPGSQLLDDAYAEQIYAEGITLGRVDDANKIFVKLLNAFPDGNAVDNAYSWMAIGYRCAKRADEAERINGDIVRLFPFTRHAKYALERIANPEPDLYSCGSGFWH